MRLSNLKKRTVATRRMWRCRMWLLTISESKWTSAKVFRRCGISTDAGSIVGGRTVKIIDTEIEIVIIGLGVDLGGEVVIVQIENEVIIGSIGKGDEKLEVDPLRGGGTMIEMKDGDIENLF